MLKPEFGGAAGQKYPVLRSIQTFLGQMAEGGARVAPAVMKELLQNADDAGATEVAVVLDERTPPANLASTYSDLLTPALFVRNNAKFRLSSDVAPGERDDFAAICDVASGHKRAQATAAGRFGIGFNSVYFLTDTPVFFSRREVHVFDLLHKLFDADGWRFPLDDFPAHAASSDGAIKPVLEWCLPKVILAARSFSQLATDPKGDFECTVFRFPLRTSPPGGPALYTDRFSTESDRLRVLSETADEAARSVLFLKNVRRVSFGLLRDREIEDVAVVEATAPPDAFREFLNHVRQQDSMTRATDARSCAFARTVLRRDTGRIASAGETKWSFHVRHLAKFDDDQLTSLRERLRLNGERAVPWVSVAVPLDPQSCRLDGSTTAAWRVFLPLLEPGPSACILSGAFFVGPSRQRTEFRLHESDEGKRRTQWNQLLVERGLVPLLQDVSSDLPSLAPHLLNEHPKDYVSLFPEVHGTTDEPANLTEFLGQRFAAGLWALSLRDVWGEPFDLLVGDSSDATVLELVPDWLYGYRDRFSELSCSTRRFIRYALGDALASRLGPSSSIQIRRRLSEDVALKVLRHSEAPHAKDLRPLLQVLADVDRPLESLDGAWAFISATSDQMLRYDADALYVVTDAAEEPHPIVKHLRDLNLPFVDTQWVKASAGLPELRAKFRSVVPNVVEPDAVTALELLRRLPQGNSHDQIVHDYAVRPIVDFLVSQPSGRITSDLRLGFLVTTAKQKTLRRRFGVILLKPLDSTPEDDVFWEIWCRRIFAEVDPGFARELQRLLKAHPAALEALHSQDCRVSVARVRHALEMLTSIGHEHGDTLAALEREINAVAAKDPDDAARLAATLLELADSHWESLDDDQRHTVAALPIHRSAEGHFLPLFAGSADTLDGVPSAFRLQSDEDIQDAPVTLPDARLLQTVNVAVKRFYRRRLHIDEHGRVSVLKDVLRQIGTSTSDSHAMLRYLATYYGDTVSRLERSGDDSDATDARELRELLAASRTVPCLDGTWQPAQRCVEAWDVLNHLHAQKWQPKRLAALVQQIFAGEQVATLEAGARELLRRLHLLRSLSSREIAARAVSSEAPDLGLRERVRLLLDNWRDFPEAGVARSAAVGSAAIPVHSGRAPLSSSEWLPDGVELPTSVLRGLAPSAVDGDSLATELGIPGGDLPRVFRALQIPRVTAAEFDNRLVARFSDLWAATTPVAERLSLLRYIAQRGLGDRLRDKAALLETALVSSRPLKWTFPTSVLTPSWSDTQPPHLKPENRLDASALGHDVRPVWESWCGIRTFGQVLDLVLDGVRGKQGTSKVGLDLYEWVRSTLGAPATEEYVRTLHEKSWVVAVRAGSTELRRPADVLVCEGQRILAKRFWVPATELPQFALKLQVELGFATMPQQTGEALEEVAECLAASEGSDNESALAVYALVEEMIGGDDSRRNLWLRAAERLRVFHMFRPSAKHATLWELFLGDEDFTEDITPTLICLKAGGSLPRGAIGQYRRLGVEERPTFRHLLQALGRLDIKLPDARRSYARAIRALHEVDDEQPISEEAKSGMEVRVLSCAGSFESVSQCFWDDEFGQPNHVSSQAAKLLIDTTDRSTRSLVEWLHHKGSTSPIALRARAELTFVEQPTPRKSSPELTNILLPWRLWASEVAREESLVREAIGKLGLVAPARELEFCAVQRLEVRWSLPDGSSVEQHPHWSGPLAIGTVDGRLFVRALPDEGRRVDSEWTAMFDLAVAREIALLWGGVYDQSLLRSCAQEILSSLERPTTVLRRLRQIYRQHFLHQYQDQVADPAFAELFEEYQRTRRGSQRADELERRMHELLQARFVNARREQIRGYGYDEFSVYAELLQNAEDAYRQRAQLGMAMPPQRTIRYRYVGAEDGRGALEVEHCGRPFNYWQHGTRQNRAFSRDVEGVLRSAGSFKPHSQPEDAANPESTPIGRFGLGFKSVYLLSDAPEIHSGAWHFAIESGCLPNEVSPPADLAEDVTRIRLPLRTDARELQDVSRLVDLVPFLRQITHLDFEARDVRLELDVLSQEVLATDSALVEEVTISAPGAVPEGSVRFLRCRSHAHAGQLAILLTRDGLPARWLDAFSCDLYAALPLRAELACGVAVSHRFEVQSGRTHLVDPEANERLINEVADLMNDLGRAICSKGPGASESLRRFWALWRWERGDAECAGLRGALAKALVQLPTQERVVPTLAPEVLTSLYEGPTFFFVEVPDAFRDAVVDAHVVIDANTIGPVALSRSNVVADGFAGAYRRACEYAGIQMDPGLIRVGWNEMATAFRERPWLAEKPELVCRLATSLNDEQSRTVAIWLAQCPVLGQDAEERSKALPPSDLLNPDFPGRSYLPRRFLRLLSDVYDEAAVALLTRAGLRPSPSSDDIREWAGADLSAAEAVAILRYLADEARFRNYWELSHFFRSGWFPLGNRRVTTAEAVSVGFVPDDVLEDAVFRSWLGLVADEEPESEEPIPASWNPQAVLEELFDWWQRHGVSWTEGYQRRLYVRGSPPSLRPLFNAHDVADRREWMKLLVLGSLHTLGRTKLEQHRDFLRRCDDKGWLDVFADREQESGRWMQVLEDYLDDPFGANHEYYLWVKQFVVIFQISRWLPEYVEVLLNVDRFKRPFAIDEIIAPRTSAAFSGTGLDAPALTRGLGMGANFVFRELIRLGVLKQPFAHPHSYVPVRRVCALLDKLATLNIRRLPSRERSSAIYRLLSELIGAERATFGGSFDLPLLALADSPELQEALVGTVLDLEEE